MAGCKVFYFIRLMSICLVLCLSAAAWSATLYDMRQTNWNEYESEQLAERLSLRRDYVEFQAAAVASFGSVKDADGSAITHRMTGWRGGAFWYVLPTVAIGGQMEKVTAHDQNAEMLTTLKRDMWAVVSKWTFTPNTEPKLYTLFGVGQAKYSTRFPLAKKDLDDHSTVVILGLGADIRVWRGLHVQGEYQFQYDTKRWDNFVLTGPRARHDFSANIAYRF